MKNKSILILIAAVVVAGGVFYALRGDEKTTADGNGGKDDTPMPAISKEDAVSRAREACKGIAMPEDAEVVVETDNSDWVVTFPIRRKTPMPGPDYHARVHIDSKTGEVKRLLVGS